MELKCFNFQLYRTPIFGAELCSEARNDILFKKKGNEITKRAEEAFRSNRQGCSSEIRWASRKRHGGRPPTQDVP